MYDQASLICQRMLGGMVESSIEVGWRSVLVERMQRGPGFADIETHPSRDTRIAIARRGSHRVEVFTAGQWTKAEVLSGALAMTAAGEVARLRWHTKTPFQTVNLYLPHDTVASAAEQLRRAGRCVSEAAPSRLAFADAAVTGVVEALLTAMREGAPDLYAEQTAHWLAIHLLVNHGRMDANGGSGRVERVIDKRLARVIDLIKARYAEPLSLEVLASEACVSKFHFARLFRQRTGVSPHAYLAAERMEAARRLLATTDLPVSEIARRTGYAQAAHLGVAFKKANGVAPSTFRRDR